MSGKLPSQASFWGIRGKGLSILELITHWFNGKPLTIREETRRIGTHHDLPLDEMFRGTSMNYETHKHAHEHLLANNLLEEAYVCRRKIDWAPTEQGVRAIRDCLKPRDDHLRPEWADSDDGGPIYGDPNEGVLHRKGVEIAGNMLPSMAWTHDHRGLPYGKTWYPENDQGEPCHDLHVKTHENMHDVGVEVITANNNADYLVNKWERYAKEDRTTFWIFDNRTTACTLFNELNSRCIFYLDGGQFREPTNWSAQAINRKLWRSKENHSGNDASDVVHTLTGLLEGDRDTIQNLFEEYYSDR